MNKSMNIKTAIIIIAIFSVAIIVTAYVIRGEFAIGGEWALPVVLAAVLPLKEVRE